MQTSKKVPKPLPTDRAVALDSAALSRLVAEIRHGDEAAIFPMAAYNRTYHRHNR
jgi:hypothetical protein